MYYTTFSGIFSFLIIAACLNSCSTPAPDLEGDPRKLSIYTVEVKRTDIDVEVLNMDCDSIPEDPCYCMVETRGDTSFITAHLKNCGEEGTAEQISVNTTVYPRGGNPVSFTSSPTNPGSLTQGSAATIAFAAQMPLSSQIDSAVFIVSWKWAGYRTIQKDTIASVAACGVCP
jgi:hypothetical protein